MDHALRYAPPDLVAFAAGLLGAAGMDDPMGRTVAELLVEADLMGHDTHGLQLLPAYVRELESGGMSGQGEAEVLRDRGPTALWDGHWLSGVWLTATAMDAAAGKARQYGIGAVTVRRAHHTACLQAYLSRATGQGLMAIIASSDPRSASVAPFGGIDPVLCPDPIAVGIPTGAEPMLIDTSASITTNGMVSRASAEGRTLAGNWLQDAEGAPSNDPAVLATKPPGSLLLAGGQDHGQKGYAMALMVEALTHGLSGYGRHNLEPRWASSIFVQVIDPSAFAGEEEFTAETLHIAGLCRASRPHPDRPSVRVPGDRANALRQQGLDRGVGLYPGIMDRLLPLAERFGVMVPKAINQVSQPTANPE